MGLHRLALVAVLAAACGSEEPGGESGMGGSNTGGSNTGASGGGSLDIGGPCNARLVSSPPTTAAHVLQCTVIPYDTNPPSGGEHYAIWPAFQSYDFPVPHGYLVHALEHGAVVLSYDCPEGCADEVAEVEGFIEALPADPSCEATPADRRAIVTPDPALESRWAASAWGFALTADCFDEDAFGDFYADHYGRGPEDLCNAGQAFTQSPCP